MIVSMQLGFAMLEVGCVRQEHCMTVLEPRQGWGNFSTTEACDRTLDMMVFICVFFLMGKSCLFMAVIQVGEVVI